MLSWPPSVRILLAAGPADMRRGFDGLARMTTELIRQDPFRRVVRLPESEGGSGQGPLLGG